MTDIKTYLQEKIKKFSPALIIKLINQYKTGREDLSHFKFVDYWQTKGVTIIPNNFYQPVPDISSLHDKLFKKISQLSGINLNVKKQIRLLEKSFAKYSHECKGIPEKYTGVPHEFHFRNLAFDWVDAIIYYCTIRHFKPKRVVEIGSEWSTKIAAKACLKNKNTELVAIEPYPQTALMQGFPGFSKLIQKRVQDMNPTFFERLGPNDILFIDSTHTVKIDSDVNYLFFEVLPKLKKGVLIHFHDIFLPKNYPRLWVKEHFKFWNEAYLLQAFLMYNDSFEVLFANSHIVDNYREKIKKTFPYSLLRAGSFWIRKIK